MKEKQHPQPAQKLTLETIAKLAGVSRSTASRVINDQAGVKAEVRQRVQDVIAETGYRPNLAARSLTNQRTGLIGLVIPRAVQNVFTDPYFPRLIQGITQVCNQHGCTLSLFLFHTEEEEKQLYPRLLNHSMLDGILVASSETHDPLVEKLAQSNVPHLTIGRTLLGTETNYVDVDNETGAYTAVSHLIRLGYQRIATITGPMNTCGGLHRFNGYKNALLNKNMPVREELIAYGDYSEISGYHALNALLAQKPDALFVASDAMTQGALRALSANGLSVPNDIALVSFDDLPFAPLTMPPLTTVRQPIKRIGVLAVETLLDIIEHGPTPTRRLIMPTELIIRSSCGAQKTKKSESAIQPSAFQQKAD
ncbi:MAG: LacI family transcriptional regulator [Chloroflexi bacterium]|nr:MAG: LacI family transcriptional regulator [Chloroflexota bacterium]